MKIDVDYRETAKIPYFEKFFKGNKSPYVTGMNVTNMDIGDVGTPDCIVGIERKAEDFVESMFSGRLDQQLKELSDNFEYPYLLVEYDGIPDLIMNNILVNPKSLIGEFTSILARHHVSVMFVGNYKTNTLFVPFVIRMIEKHYDGKNKAKDYSPIRKPRKRKITTKEIKLDTITRTTKIGKKKGFLLMEYFDWNINKIANASISDLMNVDGIGKKLANDIHEVLN